MVDRECVERYPVFHDGRLVLCDHGSGECEYEQDRERNYFDRRFQGVVSSGRKNYVEDYP
jgi:hypothetical protein